MAEIFEEHFIMPEKMKYLAIALRPRHWVKNLFLLAPLFFSNNIMGILVILRMLFAFILFCLFSSSVYLMNDIFDLEKDKNHPQKAKRPLPSGKLSRTAFLCSSLALFIMAILGSFALDKKFLLIGLVYWFIGFFYSFCLSHFVMVDVLCVAAGFMLRLGAGGVIAKVSPSLCLFVTILFLTLFLGFSKRRAELVLSTTRHNYLASPVLKKYTLKLLNQFLIFCAAGTIVSYIFSSFSGSFFCNAIMPNLIYSIPFVIFGVLRYFYLIYFSHFWEFDPTEILLQDRVLITTIMVWVSYVTVIAHKI